MPCDTRLRPNQTLSQRADEVRRAVARLSAGLSTGAVKAVVNKGNGGVVFEGLSGAERDGVTDGCLYRRIMATGSATAKMAIAKAEQLAGRAVDKQAVAQGVHSHDGGRTWHSHKG